MTPINIFDIWQKIMAEVNVQQGGQIRPQVDFQNWYNSISSEIFHEKIAKIELNQQIDDELSVFLVGVNAIVTGLPGLPYDKITLPSDYEGFANMKIIRQKEERTCFLKEGLPIIDGNGKCKQYDDPDYTTMRANFAGANLETKVVTKVDTQRWDSALSHTTKGPKYKNPKTMQIHGGFLIAPKGIQSVILEYYKTPRQAVFSYTIGTGDVVIYDPTGSVQLEWSNILENEFLTRLKKKYGIYVQDGAIYQAANEDKKQLV